MEFWKRKSFVQNFSLQNEKGSKVLTSKQAYELEY